MNATSNTLDFFYTPPFTSPTFTSDCQISSWNGQVALLGFNATHAWAYVLKDLAGAFKVLLSFEVNIISNNATRM
jgi:hypothetical protein